MKRKQTVLLGALAVVAALVIWLALRNPQPPMLPRDEDHREFSNPETCLVCHGSEGGAPRSSNHPVERDCTRCHGWP